MYDKPLSRDKYEKRLDELNGECAFCEKHDTEKLHIKEYKHWIWEYALFPYFKYHTLLVSRRHVTHFHELTDEEVLEMKEVLGNIEQRYFDRNIVKEKGPLHNQLVISWRLRADEGFKVAVRHLHIHIYPDSEGSFAKQLDTDAEKIDPTLLRENGDLIQ